MTAPAFPVSVTTPELQEHLMSEDTPPLATLFDPRELEQAAVACCGRFGDPAAETQRLVTQRDLIAASSALTAARSRCSRSVARKRYVYSSVNPGEL